MAELKDSGSRANFNTGAVRDCSEGKGRCDLLPLSEMTSIINSDEIKAIYEFQNTADVSSLLRCAENFMTKQYGNVYMGMIELSKHFEDGARKYSANNWKKGIPVYRYVDSAIRHFLKFKAGAKDEPHDRAFLWNIMCLAYTYKTYGDEMDKECPFLCKNQSAKGEIPAEKMCAPKVTDKTDEVKEIKKTQPTREIDSPDDIFEDSIHDIFKDILGEDVIRLLDGPFGDSMIETLKDVLEDEVLESMDCADKDNATATDKISSEDKELERRIKLLKERNVETINPLHIKEVPKEYFDSMIDLFDLFDSIDKRKHLL